MGVDYPAITEPYIRAREKVTTPALIPAAGMATLVSAAISGLIRHITRVTVEARSAETAVTLAVADASGSTGVIEVINFGDSLLTGTFQKSAERWSPPAKKGDYYQLMAGEKLVAVMTVSGSAKASVTFWDE